MRLAIILSILIVGVVNGQFWYSGSVNVSTTFAQPIDTTNANPCTLLTTNVPYASFSFNVTSSGFYFFSALYEKQFGFYAQIQLYTNSFIPANPCTNLYRAIRASSSVPSHQFIQYLSPGNYEVVVTAYDPISTGLFVVHVDRANYNVATNEATNNWWYAPRGQSSGNQGECEDSSYQAPYQSISWTQSTTGNFDLLFFGLNETASTWYFSAGIYNTSSPSFLGTGTMLSPTSGCSTANFIYVSTNDYSDINFDLQNNASYQVSAILGLQLLAGVDYSAVIGTYDSSIFSALFGVWIRPTILVGALGISLWVTPSVPALTTTTECTPASSQRYYHSLPFTATSDIYIIDHSRDFFDTTGILYSNYNLGNTPITCPTQSDDTQFIIAGDTGDGGAIAVFLSPSSNYTFITAPYSGTGTPGAGVTLYMYTGTRIGISPGFTTGSVTTSRLTTSRLTTSPVTSGVSLSSGSMTSGSAISGSATNLVTSGSVVSGSGSSSTGSGGTCLNACVAVCGVGNVDVCTCNDQGEVTNVSCTEASSSSFIALSSVLLVAVLF